MITEIYPKMIQENNRERKHYTPHPVNREEAFELIQEVLDGMEAPMGVRQLGKRLGLGPRTLVYHFPRECALITTIMALSFIMVLCLLIYRLAEVRLRSRLAQTQQTIPGQVQKPTARPTMCSRLSMF